MLAGMVTVKQVGGFTSGTGLPWLCDAGSQRATAFPSLKVSKGQERGRLTRGRAPGAAHAGQ